MTSARVALTKELTGTDLSEVRVLVVGAGGIGCELVKNLVRWRLLRHTPRLRHCLSSSYAHHATHRVAPTRQVLTGFEDITMIDLDTIDYSNLNRQFLFRAKHVGRSKAEVARESVLEFPHGEKLVIKAEHGNIKSSQFTLDFFKSFNIVLNGLDNVDARRHVNRVCLAADVPLVESGTEGYLGQARAIIKGKFKCYECDPPPKKESYPICTIRNHPDKPVHCISWAKELLFKKLFGGEETDLIDAAEGGADADGAAASSEAAAPPPASASMKIEPGEEAGAFARRVFRTVFEADVERLLRMETLWKERAKPDVLRLDAMTLPDAKALADVDRVAWSVEENAAVFLACTERVLTERAGEVGGLSFDKDDPDALDFVTAASNLRSEIFHIERLSRDKVKGIAGNIIPAIATTNAIIGGFIVLEALKVLRGATDRCRFMACNYYELTGRKRDRLLAPDSLDPPNKKCYVCGGSALSLALDTSKFTVAQLLDDVVKKHLSFNKPTVDYSTLDGNGDQLCEGMEDEVDEDEAAKYERYRGMTLSALPVPIGSGSQLDVEDTSQELRIKIDVTHAVLDEEKFPSGFDLSGERDAAAQASAAAADGDAAPEGASNGDAPPTKRARTSEVEVIE